MSPSKNTRSQIKRRGSPLFKLPAELRNMIYHLALIPDRGKFLIFDQTPPQDPPLLQTCKQIRSEAGSIYYGEARLRICAVDYDVSNFVRWLDLNPAREALSGKSRIGVRFTYDPTIRIWKNLMVWVDAYCQHWCPGFGDDEDDQAEEEKDENEQAEDVDDDEDEEEDDGADRPRHFDAPSTLDSVVEVFNMVHEWLLEDGMTMEELHLRLEKHRQSVLIPLEGQWAF